jgi:small subunit ribosomal protein S16
MLTIRLQRTGKKNKPEFRVILAQHTSSASKKFIEILGNYNPRTKDLGIKDESRLKYWIEQHVNLSPTIHNLFVTKNIISDKKQQAFKIPKKPVAPAATPAAPATAVEPVAAAAPAVAETPAQATTEAPVSTPPEPTAEPATENPQA